MILSREGEPTQKGTMTDIVKRLKKERDRVERQLTGINAALTAFGKVYSGTKPRKRRKLSAKAKAKIAAAQRKRWAAWKAKQKKGA
jgi:Skp family chaperone for outer membrane proteins